MKFEREQKVRYEHIRNNYHANKPRPFPRSIHNEHTLYIWRMLGSKPADRFAMRWLLQKYKEADVLDSGLLLEQSKCHICKTSRAGLLFF